jgi:adenylate cyclase
MTKAMEDCDLNELFKGCCLRLRATGIPISRAHLTFSTLHPLYRAGALTWYQDNAAEASHFPHREEDPSQWLRSPLFYLIKNRLSRMRRKLAGPEALPDFPLLEELCAQGLTDYFAFANKFGEFVSDPDQQKGIAGSWCSDRPGGFTENEIHQLDRLTLHLTAVCRIVIERQIAHNVVTAYLGAEAGRKVLGGRIQRGDVESIRAVIWYSDLRGSTDLADRLPGGQFLATLNEYFECSAGAARDHGGEILRFVGDAVLAIFPMQSGAQSVQQACVAAAAGARDCEDRLKRLNQCRQTERKPPLDFGLALHVGEVLFGNIGIPERLEFSVIGPAANEVARIEALTKTLGQRILASAEFVQHLAQPCHSVGYQQLRGVDKPVEVFSLATA